MLNHLDILIRLDGGTTSTSAITDWNDAEISSDIAALFFSVVVVEDIVTASGAWVEGRVWPSVADSEFVGVEVFAGSTVGTAAGVLFVGTTSWEAVGESVKVTPDVEAVVVDPVVESETGGEDPVAFADVPGAFGFVGVVGVVEAGDINDDAVVFNSAPSVGLGGWVAGTGEIDVEAFVAESELFADLIDSVDWGTETGGKVVLTGGQAPAAVVAVSTEGGDVGGLHFHDHGFQVSEFSEAVHSFFCLNNADGVLWVCKCCCTSTGGRSPSRPR